MTRTHTVYPPEFPEAWASNWGEDEYGVFMGFTYKGVQQNFRWIEPGEFMMGSARYEAERGIDETQHRVKLTQGFWLADTSVTQALWQVLMGGNPSRFNGDNRPVENISWTDSQQFISKMNELKPELKLCLPSEAQWEYACRAGTISPFSFGEQIDASQVNFDGNSLHYDGAKSDYREQTVDVGVLPANAWGLYEMHGNVREWCQDWYGAYPREPVIDPKGATAGFSRVLRGGSWINYGRYVRSACRNRSSPGHRSNFAGFRLARGH